MEFGKRLVMFGLVAGLSGCVSGNRMSRYPAPMFDTKPHAAARARPTPRVSPREMSRLPISPRFPAIEPGWIPPGGLNNRWTDIVIHHSASDSGGADSFGDYHRNVRGWDELGYHFVIGNGTETGDGVIEVGSRWTKQKHGAHCKTPDNHYNDHGVGICLVGNFNNRRPSRAQLASLNKLLLFLTDARGCGIPPQAIHTHKDVTHKTECPGGMFSLTAVMRDLMLSRSGL